MAPLVPFLVIGLTLALGAMIGPGVGPAPVRDPVAEDDDPELHDADYEAAYSAQEQRLRSLLRRHWGLAGVSVYLGLVIVDFAWMWPLFTGGLLTTDQWDAHMWLPSWV
jgi:dolichyl-phosphate-mannose--protein O-mannosyl transferase